MNWKEFLKSKNNKTEFILTLIFLAVVLTSLANFLNFVEARQGVVLSDPVLNLFNPIDLTWLIFSLIYISLITAIAELIRNPKQLMFAIQLYIIMVIVRITVMYLMPLEPPQNSITLDDPFVEFFGTGQTLTKDLFFSGHTATLFILFLVSEKKFFKITFLITTIAVAITVLLQHVHYTIDVLAAFIFSYACFKFLLSLKKKSGLS